VERTLNKMLEIVPGLYSAATGWLVSGDDLLRVAERVINVERAHNARLGLTAADDTMPPRFTEDPVHEGPAEGKVYDILEPMKEVWYLVHGWSHAGLPRRETLEAFDLNEIADDLERRGIDIS
jgi:aldehyde:ferredoxin oxidoreductase